MPLNASGKILKRRLHELDGAANGDLQRAGAAR
jgi:hypothetical protein